MPEEPLETLETTAVLAAFATSLRVEDMPDSVNRLENLDNAGTLPALLRR